MPRRKPDVFLKVLQSQESGYSGDTAGQRGKYILFPAECWGLLPHLPRTTRNAFTALRIMGPTGVWIGVRYVYHNTKFHTNLGLSRAHNERRIYRNGHLDKAFRLDRGILFGLMAVGHEEFVGFSSRELKLNTTALRKLAQASPHYRLDDLDRLAPQAARVLRERLRLAGAGGCGKRGRRARAEAAQSIVNLAELNDELGRAWRKDDVKRNAPTRLRAATRAGPRPGGEDPLAALNSTYRDQTSFTRTVRQIYGGRCALRLSTLAEGTMHGLHAAHIWPRRDSANFLPSNGLLLSADLHNAFDEGLWTLTGDLRVRVHPAVKNGKLLDFKGFRLSIPAKHGLFKPFSGYLAWHRKHVFGGFLKKRAR